MTDLCVLGWHYRSVCFGMVLQISVFGDGITDQCILWWHYRSVCFEMALQISVFCDDITDSVFWDGITYCAFGWHCRSLSLNGITGQVLWDGIMDRLNFKRAHISANYNRRKYQQTTWLYFRRQWMRRWVGV